MSKQFQKIYCSFIFVFLFSGSFCFAQTDADIDIPIDEVIAQLETGKVSVLDRKVNLRNLKFKTGTAALLASDKIYLDSLADYLIRIPTVKLSVEGHTDVVGNYNSNKKLSEDRAIEVANYLATKGLSKTQLSTKGWGSDKPIDKENTPEAYEKNRRVELTFKNEQPDAPEKQYKIQLANGTDINAKFVMFHSDGSIGYKETNLDSEPLKKLRPAEINFVLNPDGGILLGPTKIQSISEAVVKTEENKAKKRNPQPVVTEQPKEEKKHKNDSLFAHVLRLELIGGPSVSLAAGDFIKYQKSFYPASYPNANINGKIFPQCFFSLGFQVRYIPFAKTKLSALSVSLGANYYRRGFTNRYLTTYTSDSLDITDKVNFKEIYRLNYISIPINIRYGKKWYGQVGLTNDIFWSGKRIHKLNHKVTGADAYNNGFDSDDEHTDIITSAIVRKRSIGIQMGGGINLSNKFALQLLVHKSGMTFNTGNNFINFTFHLQAVVVLFQPNFKHK